MRFIGVSLLALLGCGGGDADDVFVTASWTVRDVAANTPLGCPMGFPKAVLTARRTDGGRCRERMTECLTVFECDLPPADGETRKATGTGTSTPLLPGVYEVQLSIASEDLSTTYAIATPETLDLTLGDHTYARQFIRDGGVFAYGWQLVGDSDRTCEQAGVFSVALLVENAADPGLATRDEARCADGRGFSFAFGNGSYTVTLEALDENSQSLGVSAPLTDQVIMGPNGITDLGTVDVVLDAP